MHHEGSLEDDGEGSLEDDEEGSLGDEDLEGTVQVRRESTRPDCDTDRNEG